MTTVLYDGYCVICQQTRRIVTALDWLKRVQFQDIHEWSAVEQRYPQLDWETAMGQVHVDTGDGKLVGGFEGARRLMRDLPLAYPFWLLLNLPGMTWLGNVIYRLIARNRYRINKFFGAPVCENGACKVHG